MYLYDPKPLVLQMLLGPGINTDGEEQAILKLSTHKEVIADVSFTKWLAVRRVTKSKCDFEIPNCRFKIKSTVFFLKQFSKKHHWGLRDAAIFYPKMSKSQAMSYLLCF